MNVRHILLAMLAIAVFTISSGSAAEFDYGKAITIGSGPKTVIEFTDPDCPFCRKASKYFEGRSDVTRYVFFYPLPRHPKAREKAQYVLSMPDKAKAYHEVMSGKMDSIPHLATTPEGVRLQEQQFEIAKKSKVGSTPTFMIYGRIIEGFDLKRIEDALGGKQ
jgi:thiol:disulfide interchange protein DsbC